MYFASDNCSPVHEKIMEAIKAVNSGHAASYSTDNITAEMETKFQQVFETDCKVFLMPTGTAANALVLSAHVSPHGAVLCLDTAHINVNECGAPEFFGCSKLLTLKGDGGKLTLGEIKTFLDNYNYSLPIRALSITQASESGTIYKPEEISAISSLAKKHNIYLHMDGARLANAVVSLGCSPAETTWKAGVDFLSFGGTKNGCMYAEAVVFFNKERAEQFGLLRSRGGHTLSKSRYMSAQFNAYLSNNLWLESAKNANSAAQEISQILVGFGGELAYPVEANEVIINLPKNNVDLLRSSGVKFFDWAGGTYRFVTSWCTTAEEINSLKLLLKKAA